MTTTKSYDFLNRLTKIETLNAQPSTVNSWAYAYNSANQRRTVNTGPDGSSWVFQYDDLGQVKSGKKYWRDGTPAAGQQFEYAFDDIGNRKQTKADGDAIGASLRAASYTNNLLNQITGRDVPGAVDVTGIAHASAGVTVNGLSPSRKGEYYRSELSFNNTTGAFWAGITNTATLAGSTNTQHGHVLLPRTAQVLQHDADGNLTNDGVFSYTWDAENRRVEVSGSPPSIRTRRRACSTMAIGITMRALAGGQTETPWLKTGGVLVYGFVFNNPNFAYDPDGRVVETLWDIFSIGVGCVELVVAPSSGGWRIAH